MDHVQKLRQEEREQWQDDNIGWSERVKQMAQQLSEAETAHPDGVQEWMCAKNKTEKLEAQLHSFRPVLSTLQEMPIDNPSAHIAEDLAAGNDDDANLDDAVSGE